MFLFFYLFVLLYGVPMWPFIISYVNGWLFHVTNMRLFSDIVSIAITILCVWLYIYIGYRHRKNKQARQCEVSLTRPPSPEVSPNPIGLMLGLMIIVAFLDMLIYGILHLFRIIEVQSLEESTMDTRAQFHVIAFVSSVFITCCIYYSRFNKK